MQWLTKENVLKAKCKVILGQHSSSVVFEVEVWQRHFKQPSLCRCCSRSSCQHTLRMFETSWQRTCMSCGQWPRLTRGGHTERSVPHLTSHVIYTQFFSSFSQLWEYSSACMSCGQWGRLIRGGHTVKSVPQLSSSVIYTVFQSFKCMVVLHELWAVVKIYQGWTCREVNTSALGTLHVHRVFLSSESKVVSVGVVGSGQYWPGVDKYRAQHLSTSSCTCMQ